MPKLGALMDEREHDVTDYMAFPAPHRSKLYSTNLLARLKREVERRLDVVGIFPNEATIIRLIGTVLLEANDEWQLQHRYMGIEAVADLGTSAHINETLQIPPKAARAVATSKSGAFYTALTDVIPRSPVSGKFWHALSSSYAGKIPVACPSLVRRYKYVASIRGIPFDALPLRYGAPRARDPLSLVRCRRGAASPDLRADRLLAHVPPDFGICSNSL